MRSIAILALILAAPAFAQEPSQPEIIALNEADAEACKQGKCVLVAPEAMKALLQRIERGDEYEAVAKELARRIVTERKNRCA